MYSFGLFADWIPKPVTLLLILLFLFPIMIISGVYTANAGYMASDLGAFTEWIIFANHACTVGMAVSLPVILRYKLRFYTKHLMLASLFTLALCSFMIGTTDHLVVIVGCSFLIGFAKMFALMELMIPVMYIISPDGDRAKFYSVFYALSLVVPQISGYFMTKIGFFTYWENVNIGMAAVMLFLFLLTAVFAHNKRFFKKVPLYYLDWMGMMLFTITFLALAYVLSFIKQQNYFRSDQIIIALVIMVGAFVLYLIKQSLSRRPFINFNHLKQYNVAHGIIMLFMLGFLLAGGSIQTKITRGVLGYDTVYANSLNLWLILGIVAAGFFSMKWLMHKKSLKFYIFIGYSTYVLYYGVMYFLVSSTLSYELLIGPSILRGFCMTILFIGVWLYALNKLSFQATAGVASVLVLIRTMIGPGVWGAIFNFLDSKWQSESVETLIGKMDGAAYTQKMAMSLYRSVHLEGLMVSSKRLYGILVLFGLVILLYLLLLNFEPFSKRSIILLRKKLSGESVEDYERSQEKLRKNQSKEEITAASGTIV